MDYSEFLKQAAHVCPSPRQDRFLKNPFYAFVHFSPNTYTGLEWGTGKEDPAIFNPVDLDCDQWVEAIKSAGMTGMVLTCKHHDGFCLWPSKYTEHCIKNSPYKNGKGDIVREASEACKRGGIRFGIYLSPWDRNSKLYGTDEYNDYYKAQLTELLTQYGEIFHVWFDEACGEGPNGRRQVYDFAGYIDLIRKYQPNACIFNDHGPDIRWVGNESGTSRYAEWMVVPHELCHRSEPQTTGAYREGSLEDIYNTWDALGDPSVIQYSKSLSFCPAEVDMSIRPGWFYHPEEEPHSLERLMQTYMTSIGGTSTFNLNIPPMPNGKFDPRDVQRLKEFGQALRNIFENEVGTEKKITRTAVSDTQCIFHVKLDKAEKFDYIKLSENVSKGQRVSNFMIRMKNNFGVFKPFFFGTTIGYQRICHLPNPIETDEFDVFILSSRDEAEDLNIQLYHSQE